MKSTSKTGMSGASTKIAKMTGGAAGGTGRLEKSAAAPGKDTRMKLNK